MDDHTLAAALPESSAPAARAGPRATGGILRTAERRIGAGALAVLCLSGLVAADRVGTTPRSTAPTPAATATDVGCELLVDREPLADRRHLDDTSAPPAAALYPDPRPAHSGRHFAGGYAVPDDLADEPLDERVVTHNLEHGSVVVWFAADLVDDEQLEAMRTWLRQRRAMGFESPAAGGIFASPSTVIGSGRGIALRAWGVAMDCDRFDVRVADDFLARHWGSRGIAPEAHLSPFPPGVMGESGPVV